MNNAREPNDATELAFLSPSVELAEGDRSEVSG
jgi:hypothetical protein